MENSLPSDLPEPPISQRNSCDDAMQAKNLKITNGIHQPSFGLGYLTPRPQVWNRACYRNAKDQTRLEIVPQSKALIQLGPVSGPVQGSGNVGPIRIGFRVPLAGSQLALRNIKMKRLSTEASDPKATSTPAPRP